MVSISFLVCFTSLETLKILERDNKYSSRPWSRQVLSEQNIKNRKTTPASQNMGLHEIQTQITHRIGENIYQLYLGQVLIYKITKNFRR